MYTLDELIDKICDNLDTEEIVEVLELSSHELCEAFDSRVDESREKFYPYFRYEDSEEDLEDE